MPYIRHKNVVDFKPTETKFVFDREVTSTKITTRESLDEEASCNTQTLYNACSGMLPAFSLHAYCIKNS
jgi:hypothetical protein